MQAELIDHIRALLLAKASLAPCESKLLADLDRVVEVDRHASDRSNSQELHDIYAARHRIELHGGEVGRRVLWRGYEDLLPAMASIPDEPLAILAISSQRTRYTGFRTDRSARVVDRRHLRRALRLRGVLMTERDELALVIRWLDVLGQVMADLRETVIGIERVGTFSEVSLRAVPIRLPRNPGREGRFSFFIDAELPEPTTNGQISLGLSLEIVCTDAEGWRCIPEIAWQRMEKPGALAACEWSSLELDDLTAMSMSSFVEALPSYCRGLACRYASAAMAYQPR